VERRHGPSWLRDDDDDDLTGSNKITYLLTGLLLIMSCRTDSNETLGLNIVVF